MVKCNGVKNKDTFHFSQKCWAWHLFCCRKTWRHNVTVCHLAGRCNATSLSCLSCRPSFCFFARIFALLLKRELRHWPGRWKMGTNTKEKCFCTNFILICGSREGAVMRALAPRSPSPYVRFRSGVMCGLSLLLLVLSLLREFFPGFSGFPPSGNNNISKFQVDRNRRPTRKPVKADVACSLNISIIWLLLLWRHALYC